MGIMQNTDGYRPGEECSHCKGRCCREKGCSLAPSDLESAAVYMKRMLEV